MQIISYYGDNLHKICMKCHILFSRKNKKNIINVSSAEWAKKVVKAYKLHFPEKKNRGDNKVKINQHIAC